MQHMKSSLSVIGIILYAIFDKTTFLIDNQMILYVYQYDKISIYM
jgi:hypothetical protein